jgi:hypothetical protein
MGIEEEVAGLMDNLKVGAHNPMVDLNPLDRNNHVC